MICEVEGKNLYRERLVKDAAANRDVISTLESKLSGAFATQAKPELVERERERLAEAHAAVKALELELAGL